MDAQYVEMVAKRTRIVTALVLVFCDLCKGANEAEAQAK